MNWSKPTEVDELWARVNADVAKFEEAIRNGVGYPRNWMVYDPVVQAMLAQVGRYPINNLGDWEAGGQLSPNAFSQERELIELLCQHWDCAGGKEDYWGYCEANGSLANIWGIATGRQVLLDRCSDLLKGDAEGKPTVFPILIGSKESHYSIKVGTKVTGIDNHMVDCNTDGSINLEALKAAIALYSDRPIIMLLTTGTTVKQGRDDLLGALEIAAASGRPDSHFFVVNDAAYEGISLPLLRKAIETMAADTETYTELSDDARTLLSKASQAISLENVTPSFALAVKSKAGGTFRIDYICTSGHKFIGARDPMAMLVTRREYSNIMLQVIEYTKSDSKTLSGSRAGNPIYETWLLLKRHGTDRMTEWAIACVLEADKMAKEMRAAGIENVLLNPLATTIYFPQPSKCLMSRHSLAPEKGYCHMIVAPHTLDEFGGVGSARRFLHNLLEERRAGQQCDGCGGC